MTADVPRFYVTMGYLYGLFDYLAEKSLGQDKVLDAINLPAVALESPDLLLPVDCLDVACHVAALVADDPLIGFRAGERMRPSHLGIVGHMFLCGHSIQEIAQLGARYGKLVSNGADMELNDTDGVLTLNTRMAKGRSTPHCRIANDYNVAGWISMCRWLAGGKLSLGFMQFPGPEEVSYDSIRAELNCDIEFGGSRTIIALPSEPLSLGLRSVDEGVRSMIESSMQRRLALLDNHYHKHDDTLSEIVNLICANLADGIPELEVIASRLGKTARQLRYTLKNKNTSFKQLVDASRKEMAIKHIADPMLQLVDVALLLGFSDQTTFHRAFKRWFGKSPGNYRKESQG